MLPTVTIQATTDIFLTTVTGNGTITDTGNGYCTKRGFVLSLTSHGDPGNVAPAASDYELYFESVGSFSASAFNKAITALSIFTPYYIRAYAYNASGYSYSAQGTFQTLPSMSQGTWGLMPKSQIENETIETAIERIVDEHNDDEESHLAAGQSLQSHKAALIIDHIAESVVNDKLHPYIRAYVAVVDLAGLGDYLDIQEAIDYAAGKGGGIVKIKRGHYYPPADLVLGKCVDLEGDGIDETIIDFNGHDRAIKGYVRFDIEGMYFENTHWILGSPIVTFVAGMDVTKIPHLIWPGMTLENDDEGTIYTVLSVDSPTQITLTAPSAHATGDTGFQCKMSPHFTNGSPVVTFPAGSKLITDGVIPMMSINDDEGESDDWEILSVDSETQLTLTTDYTGTTGDYNSYITEYYPPYNNVLDLTVQNSLADFAIDMYDTVDSNIFRVKFLANKGAFRSYSYSGRLEYLRDCIFLWNTGAIVIDVENYHIEGCYSAGITINQLLINAGNKTWVVNNYFDFYATAGCKFIRSQQGYSYIAGNRIVSVEVFDDVINNVTPYAFGVRLIGNYISALASKNTNLPYRNSVISGNTFYNDSSYKPILTADSAKNAVVGNVSARTILDSGTNNEVAHNVNIY